MKGTLTSLLVVLLSLISGITMPVFAANTNPADITTSYTYNGITYTYDYYGDLISITQDSPPPTDPATVATTTTSSTTDTTTPTTSTTTPTTSTTTPTDTTTGSGTGTTSQTTTPNELIVMSTVPDHTNPVPLLGETVSGNIYVYLNPDTEISSASFFLDDQGMIGNPLTIENILPFDFMTTVDSNGFANPFDTATLADGLHNITVSLQLSSGINEVISADFNVANAPVASNSILLANPDASSTEINTAVNIDILANDSNPDNLPVTLSIIEPPVNGGFVIEADNTITYTPTIGYTGTDSLLYQIVNSNGDTAIASVSVDVLCSTCLTNVSVTLNWDPNPDNVIGYVVYMGPTETTASQLVSELPLNSGLLNPLSPSIAFNLASDLGLAQGDNVCFRLKAYNEIGFSDFSNATCYQAAI